jgi:hypothetical protein
MLLWVAEFTEIKTSKIVNAKYIKPAAFYGGESWTLTKIN